MSPEHEHTILRQIRVKYFVLLAIFILQWSQLRVGRTVALRHRGRLHSTNQMQAGGYPHGHALHNHSLIIACWRGLKCKCIIRGKHCLIYKTSLSTIFQKCTQKAKGGQHLIRHGCPFKWSKWCLFYYHFRFQSMPSRAIQCGLHLEISSLGPLQSTLHRWRTGCVKVKTGSGFYSWWHKPQFESDHCLGTFQGKHFTASPQPKASRAQLQRNSLTFTQPEFLWKWVLTENSHMCYLRWPEKGCAHGLMYVFSAQPRTLPPIGSLGWRTSSRFTVSMCPSSEVWLRNWQGNSLAWLNILRESCHESTLLH